MAPWASRNKKNIIAMYVPKSNMPPMNPVQSTMWQYDQNTDLNTFHITDICLRTNMPVTLHLCVLLHYYSGLNIDATLLHTNDQRKTTSNKYSAYYCQICVNKFATQMSYIWHICKLVHARITDNYVSIYTLHEFTAIDRAIRSTALYMFHIIGICPSTNMPVMCHICSAALNL